MESFRWELIKNIFHDWDIDMKFEYLIEKSSSYMKKKKGIMYYIDSDC